MSIEVRKHPERHTENDCGGEIEIRINRKKKQITTVCLKCRRGSIIEQGKVISEGVAIPE